MKINVVVPHEQFYSTWAKRSVFASHSTFPEILIHRNEYQQKGARIVNRKFHQ
jgi:actin-related protein